METGDPTEPSATELWVASTWTGQLQGKLDTSVDADVDDIDLFDTSPDAIGDLRADARLVICSFSAGSYEAWRPDAEGFTDSDLGAPLDGFEDECWLDVRSETVRAVIVDRLDRAADAGCDGVEPDNVDGDTNGTGFDADLHVDALVDHFDFAVNEQCQEFDECGAFQPFIEQGKPVFDAAYAQEYVDDSVRLCDEARRRNFRTLVLPLDLDGSFRISCDG